MEYVPNKLYRMLFFYMLANTHWDIFPSPPPHKLVLELPKIKSRQSTSRSSGLRSRKSLNLCVYVCVCECVCLSVYYPSRHW
jgi:hypothetical protein